MRVLAGTHLGASDTSGDDRATPGRRLKTVEFELGQVMHGWEAESAQREQLMQAQNADAAPAGDAGA